MVTMKRTIKLEEILNEFSPEDRRKIQDGGARLIAEERLRRNLKSPHQPTQTEITDQFQIADLPDNIPAK